MYSKPAMKYKYRGHVFSGDLPVETEPRFVNSIFANLNNRFKIKDNIYQGLKFNENNTSLSENTNSDTTSLSQPKDNGINTLLEGASSFYAPYQTAQDAGNWFAKQAAAGKGPYANLYKETVDAAMNPTVEGVTAKSAEEAAKEGAQAVGNNASKLVGSLLTAAQFAKEVNDGYKNKVGTDPYSSTDAYNAVWGDGKTLGNVNVRFWNNIAGNYQDFVDSLNENVHFDSNAQGAVPLATDWKNARRIDWNEDDLRKGFGQHALDTIAGVGQGAMAGFTSGGLVGGILGGLVGLSEDITNKISAINHKKDIINAKNKANQNIFNEAINRKMNIMNDEKRRSEMRFASLGGNLFDQGGPMLTKFETGGSHEENPLGGIPQGIAPDGQPNLVEQGETKWDEEDYIFSKRLTINKRLAKEYNLPDDFIGKTFAYATEKFNEKFKEHENDAISLATQKAIFSRTREAQEALRADIEMKRLAEQMKNLTPEEQQTLLTQMEQQPMETQQMQYPNGASGMQQMQPMQEMPTMLQDPYGQGQAMIGALGGQFNGGHKFSGLDVLTQYIKDQYPVETEDQISAILNKIKANPEQYVDSWNAYLINTNNQENLQYLTLLDNLNNLSTADIKQDTKNTETVWEKNYKNRQVVGNTTSDNPQPETIHNLAFQKTISDVFIQKVQDIKDSDKTVAEKRKEIQKLADEWNEYNKLYSELYTISTDKKKSDKEVQAKVKELQTKFNDWGLNAGLTPEVQKQLNTLTVPQGNIAASDNPVDSIYGERTNARYLDARTPELIDTFNSVGVQIGKWDNDEKALHDALTPTVNTKYQTLNPEYNPADPNSPKYLDITIPEAIVNNPNRIKDWLTQEGYVADGTDSTIPEDVFYYKKDAKAPEKQAPANNPNLLPTWMRGVGAVLPFMFLDQKSDYSNADMIQAPKIGFTPIADYLKYRPLDKQYYLNTANAKQQNLRNNIINMSGGNRAAAVNNLMLADLQAQDEVGKLYRMAEEYNADQRAKVAAQNADVNKFNSQGFFNADQWNAQAEFQARQARAQMRHNIDTATAQANGANLTQGIQNLIGIGDENARLNMINTNPAYAAYLDKLFQVQHKGTPTACGGYLTIKNSKKRR